MLPLQNRYQFTSNITVLIDGIFKICWIWRLSIFFYVMMSFSPLLHHRRRTVRNNDIFKAYYFECVIFFSTLMFYIVRVISVWNIQSLAKFRHMGKTYADKYMQKSMLLHIDTFLNRSTMSWIYWNWLVYSRFWTKVYRELYVSFYTMAIIMEIFWEIACDVHIKYYIRIEIMCFKTNFMTKNGQQLNHLFIAFSRLPR